MINNFPLLAIIVLFLSCNSNMSRPDNNFDNAVTDPQLQQLKPKVLFDEAHKNHHTLKTTYKPFADLIENDGCVVRSTSKPIDKTILEDIDIFIIATATGEEDPGDKSPFTQGELSTIEQWVQEGGSLLLITEHYPFGKAMAPLLNTFGVEVHNGYTEDTLLMNDKVDGALLFTKAHGKINPLHPMMQNVDRINTFTGSAVKGDSTWTPLLIFTPAAQNYNVKVEVKRDGGNVTTNVEYSDFYPAQGYAQGICKNYGQGKVVVLAESAFITAQIDRNGNKFGMNVEDQDNKQFALNMIRWLAHP